MSNPDETAKETPESLESNLHKRSLPIWRLLGDVTKYVHDIQILVERIAIELREFEALLENKGYVTYAKEKKSND